MTDMNIIQAVNNALALEMARDESVVILGEDVGSSVEYFEQRQVCTNNLAKIGLSTRLSRKGDHRKCDWDGPVRVAAGSGNPVRRLHLPRIRPNRE